MDDRLANLELQQDKLDFYQRRYADAQAAYDVDPTDQNSSFLNEKWFVDFKEPEVDKIRLLYVARINPVKGINEFLKIFKQIDGILFFK